MRTFSVKTCWLILSGLFMLVNNRRAVAIPLGEQQDKVKPGVRERIKLNESWRFMRYTLEPDKLMYDVRPAVQDANDSKVADASNHHAQPRRGIVKN